MLLLRSFGGWCALMLSASPVQASLVDLGVVTRDTGTGLDWLDVSVTLGLSYNEALQTGFVTEQGFRPATIEEVAQLFLNAGAPTQGLFQPNLVLEVEQLIFLMGYTLFCNGGQFGLGPASAGFADLVPPDGSLVLMPFVQLI